MIGALRDDGVAPAGPQPSLADLPRLIEEARQAGGLIEYECALDDPPGVPGSIGRHAYRVVQEGLTNARKHAPGGAVEVRIDGAARRGLSVEIANGLPDRRVTDAPPGAGAGLPGLAERMALAGGRLEHGSDNGRHMLRAWMPWPQ